MKNQKKEKKNNGIYQTMLDDYTSLATPISFASENALYNHYGGSVSMRTIRDFLSTINAYTLHKEKKKNVVFNPVFVYR